MEQGGLSVRGAAAFVTKMRRVGGGRTVLSGTDPANGRGCFHTWRTC